MIKYIGDDNNWYSFLSELFNLLRSYKNMLAYLNIELEQQQWHVVKLL